MRPPVSLCMIVRNEEANIADCLAPVAGLVGEIVVVDTGSSDRTKEVAARFGAKVYDFAWRDDFAAARNESCRHAMQPWIFWLDADDRIDEANRGRLANLFGQLRSQDPQSRLAYVMQCSLTDPLAPDGQGAWMSHVRLFRNNSTVSWRGRIHETPEFHDPAGPTSLCWSDVVIRHLGYENDCLVQRKLRRDMRLLQIEYATSPENPQILFDMGRIRLLWGQVDEALRLLRLSVRRNPNGPHCPYTRKAHALIVTCLRQLRRTSDAMHACQEGLRLYPDDPELLFSAAGMLAVTGDLAAAEACYLRLLDRPQQKYLRIAVDPHLCGARSRYMLALVYQQMGRMAAAEQQFLAALVQQPAFADAWMALGHLYLAQNRQRDVQAVVARLSGCRQSQAMAAALEAQLCLTQQRFDEARRLIDRALRRAPDVSWLKLTLADLLFDQGSDWQQCLEVHEQLLRQFPDNEFLRQRLALITPHTTHRQAHDEPVSIDNPSPSGVLVLN